MALHAVFSVTKQARLSSLGTASSVLIPVAMTHIMSHHTTTTTIITITITTTTTTTTITPTTTTTTTTSERLAPA